jgi:hypothetical protein
MAELLLAVGYEARGRDDGQGTHAKTWQAPELPCPTIRAGWSGDGGPGWLLVAQLPEPEEVAGG